MASKKSRAAGSRRKSSRKTSTRGSFGFWAALVTSSLAALQVTSCTLDPGWNSRIQKHLPDLSAIELPGIGSGASRTPDPAAPVRRASGPAVATRFDQCRQFFPGEPPVLSGSSGNLRELCFSAFAVLHNGQTKTPVFVVERLSRASLQRGSGLKRTDRFYADARLPAAERAELADYKGSGYSRGHMAPAADMPTEEGMAQSFSLANMVPQNQKHNGGDWAKIEDDTRKYALRATGDIYVYTGPVYDGAVQKTIGPGKVAVPSHVFKLVYDPSTGKSWAHWHQNADGPQSLQPISYAQLVERTGLHLIPALEH